MAAGKTMSPRTVWRSPVHGDEMVICAESGGFLAAVEDALTTDSPGAKGAPLRRPCESWDHRIEDISRHIEQTLHAESRSSIANADETRGEALAEEARHDAAAHPRHPTALVRFARRRSDYTAAAMGAGMALLLLALPLQAALASAAVAAFVVLALVDTRVALLALLLVRSTIDVTATVPLVGAGGSSEVNAAAMMSLLVIAIGVAHMATHRTDVFSMPLAKPFLFFLFVALVGVVLAPDPNRALQDWTRAAGAFIVYVLVVDLMRSRDDRTWMLRVLVLSSLIPITVGLVQWFTDSGDKGTDGFNRIFGTFTHPSPYGFYLVSLLPLAMGSGCIHSPRCARGSDGAAAVDAVQHLCNPDTRRLDGVASC